MYIIAVITNFKL